MQNNIDYSLSNFSVLKRFNKVNTEHIYKRKNCCSCINSRCSNFNTGNKKLKACANYIPKNK